MWDVLIAVLKVCNQQMQTHELHPVELIRMVILHVKIKAVIFKIGDSGHAIAAVLPAPFAAPKFEVLEKYIKA